MQNAIGPDFPEKKVEKQITKAQLRDFVLKHKFTPIHNLHVLYSLEPASITNIYLSFHQLHICHLGLIGLRRLRGFIRNHNHVSIPLNPMCLEGNNSSNEPNNMRLKLHMHFLSLGLPRLFLDKKQ